MVITYVISESEEQFDKFKSSKVYNHQSCYVRLTDACQIAGMTNPSVLVLSDNVPGYTEMTRVIKLSRISLNLHHEPVTLLPPEAYA